jgi:nicotinamidase-related amidase
MKPALLVIDIQKAFFESKRGAAESLTSAMEYINAAIALFRGMDLPVICVQHIDEEEKLVPGQEGFDLPEALAVIRSDLHIHKTYSNAFTKTTLERELRTRGVDTVIITGYCAEFCVLSTYRGAQDLDLTPIILRGSLASGKPENIAFVESISDVLSYGALEKVLA